MGWPVFMAMKDVSSKGNYGRFMEGTTRRSRPTVSVESGCVRRRDSKTKPMYIRTIFQCLGLIRIINRFQIVFHSIYDTCIFRVFLNYFSACILESWSGLHTTFKLISNHVSICISIYISNYFPIIFLNNLQIIEVINSFFNYWLILIFSMNTRIMFRAIFQLFNIICNICFSNYISNYISTNFRIIFQIMFDM